MRAMILRSISSLEDNPTPLEWVEWPEPQAGPGEALIRVSVCGVCHTELDEIEGRAPPSELPMILGHEVVGSVVDVGNDVAPSILGQRVGVAWIFSACGACDFCQRGLENLCSDFRGSGKDAYGGYAEMMVAPRGFVHVVPDAISDTLAAPLLCAGAIGHRSLKLTRLENGAALGLTGFGASGHLVLRLARYLYPNSPVYVFARSERERRFALDLGAAWAGDTTDTPPSLLRAIIDTTPAWTPIAEGLRRLEPGGRLVINAIRKQVDDQEVLANLSYPEALWMEKEIKSVANITREDVREFLDLAAAIPIQPAVEEYDLKDANRALFELKSGNVRGAKVLRVNASSR